MMQIDSAILATDKVICKNISRFDDSERGLLSQNILAQLRNFVEYIADKVYAFAPPIIYTLDMEVDIMTLFEKFKDKTLFITVQNGTLFPTYKGTILSQVEDFIEFKTENNTIWINLKYIVKFIVVE